MIDFNHNIKVNESDLLKEPEEYENIVDKYSKHEFMIINGQTATDGP